MIVEDHASLREALSLALERTPGFRVVGEAGTLDEGMSLVGVPCDVAIVDLGLPDGSGVTLVSYLTKPRERSRVLILTASLDEEDAALAVEAGASGVINKSRGLDEIISAVRRLAGGEEILPPDEVLRMYRIAREARARDAEARLLAASLTPREREVLRAMTEGLGRKEIARKLSISPSTEHTHVNRILGKLGVHSRLEAVLLAARHDLTGMDPPPGDTRRNPPYPTSGARAD